MIFVFLSKNIKYKNRIKQKNPKYKNATKLHKYSLGGKI
jgi:hypothetical protein